MPEEPETIILFVLEPNARMDVSQPQPVTKAEAIDKIEEMGLKKKEERHTTRRHTHTHKTCPRSNETEKHICCDFAAG